MDVKMNLLLLDNERLQDDLQKLSDITKEKIHENEELKG